MTRECGNANPAKAMLELANANERLSREVAELKQAIALLQADNKNLDAENKELEADNQMLERQRNKWFEKCQQIEQERDNYLRQLRGECPNCGSPNWDKVTGCDVCSLGPEDLT